MKLITFVLSAFFALTVQATSIVLTEANSVSINQEISSEFVASKQLEAFNKASKLKAGDDLYLVLYTPGGSVLAGMLFIDTMKALKVKVHTITIFAASMGYQIAENLGTRYMLGSGILMSHRGAVGGVSGQINGELNSRVQFYTDISNRLDSIVAKRVGTSLKAYQDSIVNELWLTSDKAVASNHADEIAEVSCDQKLIDGKVEEKVYTMFGAVDVTFSACPLITDPLSVKSSNSRAKARVKQFYANMAGFIKTKL